MFGRMVDNSDTQYAGIRNKLFILIAVMIGQMFITRILNYFSKSSEYSRIGNGVKMSPRHVWSLIFSTVFLVVLLGSSFIKVLILVTIPYGLEKLMGTRKVGVGFIWIYCIAILFCNHWFQGYRFSAIHGSLLWLDLMQGLGFRWFIVFNFTILRIISYTTDKYWAHTKHDQQFSVSILIRSI